MIWIGRKSESDCCYGGHNLKKGTKKPRKGPFLGGRRGCYKRMSCAAGYVTQKNILFGSGHHSLQSQSAAAVPGLLLALLLGLSLLIAAFALCKELTLRYLSEISLYCSSFFAMSFCI